jgi:murein L,D-transpeptidase YcbB/YkuD
MTVPVRRRIAPVALAALALAALLVPLLRCSRRPPLGGRVRAELRSLFGSKSSSAPPAPPVFRSWLTPVFYANRDFRPAWVGDAGLAPQARSLVDAVSDASAEGLDPCDYDRDDAQARIFQALRAGSGTRDLSPSFLAGLDTLLTDVFFRYASHLAEGKVDPEIGLVDWNSKGADGGLAGLLEVALAGNDIRGALQALRPQHDAYLSLREALKETRERLARLPDLETSAGAKSGPAGRRSALILRDRKVLEDRIEALSLNLERWRWLPRFLGRRYILVDTASYRLELVENGRETMSMKVVVGNLSWPTPFLEAAITGFFLNPVWNCTSNIFYRETINYIRADKNYLPSNKMVILQGWGSAEHELDPASLDWTKVGPDTYPGLHLRQLGGPLNILGRLKFIMPNPQDIYLHDTPYQDDFKQNERIFSHGCIRAERPFDLAAALARDPRWTVETMKKALENLEERKVELAEPVPIYVNYFTLRPASNGTLQRRRDVYGQDAKLAAALAAHPPAR